MTVKDLKRKLEKLEDDMSITWEFFGVIEAANVRSAYTSKEIPNGTYYKWDNVPEPLFIIDRDFDELCIYLGKTI